MEKIKSLLHKVLRQRFIYPIIQKFRSLFIRLINRFHEPDKIDTNNYLTPEVYTVENKGYMQDLNRAVENKNVKNIAILGGYGTGKSSVLKEFADGKKNIRYVSLLHLSDKRTEVNIQKEIFSQLFYKLDPNASYGSEFGRVGRRIIFRNVVRDVLIAIAFILPLHIYYLEERRGDVLFLEMIVSLIFVPIGIWGIVDLLNRMKIQSMSFANFAIKNKNIKFLEQFEDEIINIFRNSIFQRVQMWILRRYRYEIVIFEDIDRFNEYEIYVVLRHLNFILNNSDCIKRRIIFIYALKESLIKEAEERNKLFDYTLPIVPFRASYDYRKILREKVEEALKEKSKELWHWDKGENCFENKNELYELLNFMSGHIVNERVARGFYELVKNTIKFGMTKYEDPTQPLILAFLRYFSPNIYEDFIMGKGEVFNVHQKTKALEKKIMEYNGSIDSKRQEILDKLKERLRIGSDGVLYVDAGNGQKAELRNDNVIEIFGRDIIEIYGHDGGYRYDLKADEVKEVLKNMSVDFDKKRKYEGILNTTDRNNAFSLYKYIDENKKTKNKILDSLLINGFIKESIFVCASSTNVMNPAVRIFMTNFINRAEDEYREYLECDVKEIMEQLSVKSDYRNIALINHSIFRYLEDKGEYEKIKLIIHEVCSESQKDNFYFCLNFACIFMKNNTESSVPALFVREMYYASPDKTIISLNNIGVGSAYKYDLFNLLLRGENINFRILGDNEVKSLSSLMRGVDVSVDNHVLMAALSTVMRVDDIDYGWMNKINIMPDNIADMIFDKLLMKYSLIKNEYYEELIKYGISKKKQFPEEYKNAIMEKLTGDVKILFQVYNVNNIEEMKLFLRSLGIPVMTDIADGKNRKIENTTVNKIIFRKMNSLGMLGKKSGTWGDVIYITRKNN